MLSSALLYTLVASAFLARSGYASPMIQPRTGWNFLEADDNWYNYNPNKKVYPTYTALGDSYASGVGAFERILDDNQDLGCRRSTLSYPYQFQKLFGPISSMSMFNFPACAGANPEGVTHQIEAGTSNVQLPSIGYDFGNPDLVSISVGGNTGHMFSNTIEACVLSLLEYSSDSSDYYKPCEEAWYNDLVTVYGLAQRLPELFEKAVTTNLTLGQKREVYVIGYARFYNTDDGDKNCPDKDVLPTPTLDGIALEMNGIVEALNAQLRNAAEKVGAVYVDIDAAFEGHRICDKDSWFHTDGPDIFHPIDVGHQWILRSFSETALGKPEYRVQDEWPSAVSSP